jgi:superfamily II DNA or RNA helicase
VSILRPYQRQAIAACWAAITPGGVNRVAVEMATGLGKTITFAALIDDWLTISRATFASDMSSPAGPQRALVLVHTDELVWQAVDKIRLVTKGRWSIGVVKAKDNEVSADIIVASVQTLARPGRKEQIEDVGLIVVDECHHATARTYTDILEWFGSMPVIFSMNPEADRPATVPTFGFTATLRRSDGQGLGHVWQDLAFSRSLLWGIRHGYLVDLVPYTIYSDAANTTDTGQLDAQLADSFAPEAVVQAWLNHALAEAPNDPGDPELPSTLLFAPLVRSAQAFAEAFALAGVKAEVVHGGMSRDEIRAVEDRLRTGVTTVVCNAMIWTEGKDIPRVKCIVVARPTQSSNLFIQMIGRGLRPWLEATAPPRDQQRCVLLAVQGTTTAVAGVADLSEGLSEPADGKSLLAMADEYLMDVPVDEDTSYRGPVRVERWDAIVQQSSKAWKFTEAGVPFLPLRKRSGLYVYVVDTPAGHEVWSRMQVAGRKAHNAKLATAPDLELAMALAEDEAQERGGDIGSLLADKTRPWRKAVPSVEMLNEARRVGVPEPAIAKIMASKAGGKAGKLSDLIDTVAASRVLDGNVTKIRERARA